MADNKSLTDLLREHAPYDLLANEFKDRVFALNMIDIKKDWKGHGPLRVPFVEAPASSIAFGGYSTNIAPVEAVKGTVSEPNFMTGSIKFNDIDLQIHKGKINEGSFLKMLPTELERHVRYMKTGLSGNLLNGAVLAKATDDGTAGGVLAVDRPDRFVIGQEIQDNADDTWYVIAIDRNAKTVTLSATRGGSAADISSAIVDGENLYLPGAKASSFTSFADILLSATNGGSDTLYGKTKASYTFLNNAQFDGGNSDADSIVGDLYDWTTDIATYHGGAPTKIVMDLGNFATIMKKVEATKGGFNIIPESKKTTMYGYHKIQILGAGGNVLEFCGVKEMDKDKMYIVDPSTFKFHTDQLVRRVVSPDGDEYYTERSGTGYTYISDHVVYGDLVCDNPCGNGAVHSLSL
jgi:hypothetical protein